MNPIYSLLFQHQVCILHAPMKLPEVLKHFRPRNIILAVIIGLGVALYLIFKDFDISVYKNLEFTWQMAGWLSLSIIMMGCRDLGYMIRLRILSENKLNWRKSFQVIMLWEFASAVTPSAIGGTAVALFIVAKEKLSAGRSTAIVLLTSYFDELFYISMVPLILLVIGIKTAFPDTAGMSTWEFITQSNMFLFFALGYLILFSYTIFLAIGLIRKPLVIKRILFKVSSLPVLKRFRKSAIRLGTDIVVTSEEFKTKPRSFWWKAFWATFISWSARFFMVNCLIMAFFSLGLYENFVVYGRQLIMWVILLVTPTPGGSGAAEVSFDYFLGEFLPIGIVASVALLWRLLSYYPYIIIGSIVLPRWLKRVL